MVYSINLIKPQSSPCIPIFRKEWTCSVALWGKRHYTIESIILVSKTLWLPRSEWRRVRGCAWPPFPSLEWRAVPTLHYFFGQPGEDGLINLLGNLQGFFGLFQGRLFRLTGVAKFPGIFREGYRPVHLVSQGGV